MTRFWYVSFFLFCFPMSPLLFASQTMQSDSTPFSPTLLKSGQGQLIVCDPGHGGFDLGASTHFVEEKKLSLETAFLVKKYLNQMGYRVVLTRCRDIYIPLKKRTEIANSTKSHLFISIHYNAHPDTEIEGIEVFYYGKGGKWRSNASQKLARLVLSRLLARTHASSRGVKHGNFHVVREAKMPAILIEGGFVTNLKEGDFLKKQRYMEQISLAVAEGVDRYFSSLKKQIRN